MNNKYTLSIAIPAYGYPRAVRKNVYSLLKIQREDIEIVVVDNDPTGEQIGDFLETINDDRVHYYRNEKNIGRSANIVKAIEMSSSDFVLLMSCDDFLYNDKIESLLSEIQGNPDAGIIMGRIKTDLNRYFGYVGERRVYKAGYEALNVIAGMGVLFPFVVNKKYLDFRKLYSKEETYMQMRIYHLIAGIADFIGLSDVIAEAIDQETYADNPSTLELYESLNWEKELSDNTWSLNDCYFSPLERAHQLQRDIESIEPIRLRHSHFLRLVDKWTTIYMLHSLEYVALSHDLHNVKNGGSVGHMTYKEALNIFRKEMDGFFKMKADKGQYYYCGCLDDKIENEYTVIEEIERMIQKIQDEDDVNVYNTSTEVSEKIKGILKYMGIHTTEKMEDRCVLVSGVYDSKLERHLNDNGAKDVLFFDRMSFYMTIVWTSRHKFEDIWGDYHKFF